MVPNGSDAVTERRRWFIPLALTATLPLPLLSHSYKVFAVHVAVLIYAVALRVWRKA